MARRKATTGVMKKGRMVQPGEEPYPGYNAPDQVAQREAIYAHARRQAELRRPHFANWIIEQGYLNLTPKGDCTWLDLGRKMFGKEAFDSEMRRQTEIRRNNRRGVAPPSDATASSSSSSEPSGVFWLGSPPQPPQP